MMTDIIKVMDAHSSLTVAGLCGELRPNFEQDRAMMLHPIHVGGFRRAAAWLSHVPKIKRGGWGSYFLKHVAEDWAGRYIANGMMIAAAYHLGFRVDHMPKRINALIGVASARHWPLRADSNLHDWAQRRGRQQPMITPPPLDD